MTLISIEQRLLHGHEVTYRIGGSGPVLLLLHGITGSSRTWEPVIEDLAESFTVVAPDLLGHGQSAKPQGDYSLGAYASAARDLLAALGLDRATVVGHSLGGGVAMQFAYQFPQRTQRLVLIGSGGLGRDVTLLLRAATLPGSELVLSLLGSGHIGELGDRFGRFMRRVGFQPSADRLEMWRGFRTLEDHHARAAFLATLRNIVDVRGQRVSARDRLYLAADMPTLLVWGSRDPVIPLSHAHDAHEAMPGSRLEVFAHAGHFPHRDDPRRFARLLVDFVRSTEPAEVAEDHLRERLRTGEA